MNYTNCCGVETNAPKLSCIQCSACREMCEVIGDDEIETYEQESRMTKAIFSILLLVIAIGFIIGNYYLRTL